MRTHYEELNVSEQASPEVIRAAYEALAKKWDPDNHPNQRDKARRCPEDINMAFEVLSDNQSRAAYDLWLRRHREQNEFSFGDVKSEADSGVNISGKFGRFDVFFLNFWIFVALPVPVVLIFFTVVLRRDVEPTFLGLVNVLNFNQIIFIAFSLFLVFSLRKRLLYAWYLNWIPLVAAPALVFKIGGYGGVLGAICALWLFWSSAVWLRLKPIFLKGAEWPKSEGEQLDMPRSARKPLRMV